MWAYNYFAGKVEGFNVEMDNSKRLRAARLLHQEGRVSAPSGHPRGSHVMSMAVGGKKGGAIADINVTPMADIMIVLLIIFMVITPMLQKAST